MLTFAHRPGVSLSFPLLGSMNRWRWLGTVVAGFVLMGQGITAEPVQEDFGKDIQLAPFVVNGRPLSISIHARTKSDRRYAEKFADEVVEIAYETLGKSTGKGLIIVGAEGEPHPIIFFRKFMEMAQAGQLDPNISAKASDLTAMIANLKAKFHFDDEDRRKDAAKKMDEAKNKDAVRKKDEEITVTLSFDTVVPALPVPLAGVASKLYQLAWAENFDNDRVERRLRSLTVADLDRDEFVRYDWVFYLPPHSATAPVLKNMVNQAMAAGKMGMFKRAAIRSALFVLSPLVKKGVEGMRKGFLFMTILHTESSYNEGDIDALTQAYLHELKPELKLGSGDEHRRALAAIEKQKLANAEYAKDPFVKPPRLATFDSAAYAPFEGEYTAEPPKVTHRFKREGDSFQWNYKTHSPLVFYPAGDRLLVNEDGTMTIRFLVDDSGAVTGVEERWVRRRQTIPRKIEARR